MDIPKLAERREAARLWEEYQNKRPLKLDPLRMDYDDNICHCAVTGEPILVSDEIVEDPETGEVFLRCALGLPLRNPDLIEDAA